MSYHHNLSAELDYAFFTGHRQVNRIVLAVEKLIDLALSQGITHFFSGMALGTDMVAAQLLSQRGLAWTAVIPFPKQAQSWSTRERNQYFSLLEKANEQIVIAQEYSPTVYALRNQFMVAHSQVCLAVYDGRHQGGTAMTLKMAMRADLDIHIWNTKSGEISSM